MSKIFISHSSANNAAALALAKWLAGEGWDDYFLDITPTRGLVPGERWADKLRSAADRCEVVLVLVSPAWLASPWCLAEFLLAKQLGKTIFGVVIEPTPFAGLPRELTSERQLCDLVSGDDRQSFHVSEEPIVAPPRCRFRGLVSRACASGCNGRGWLRRALRGRRPATSGARRIAA